MKVGDLVRLTEWEDEKESHWRGMVLRQALPVGGPMGEEYEEPEWLIHWLHHPLGEESLEYGYYLEVCSESR